MAYVAVCENETARTDNRGLPINYASVDNHMFAYNGIVSNRAESFVAFPSEILRVGSDNGSLIYFYFLAKCSAADNGSVRHDSAAIADNSVGVNKSKWMYGDVFADFGGGVNKG